MYAGLVKKIQETQNGEPLTSTFTMAIFLMDNTTEPGNVDKASNRSGPTDVERVLVPILDTFILVTGVVGHVLVIIIICRMLKRGCRQTNGATTGGLQQANRNGTDILLLSLSVADLLLLSCIPYQTVAIATYHWPFGDFMCKAVSFLGAMCTSASAFTLAALAFSRYITVVHPTKAYRWRRDGRIKVATGVLWLPAIVLASPQFAWRTLVPGTETHEALEDLICFNFLSDTGQLAYSVCHFLFAFAFPLVVIVVAYGNIYRFLRKARQGRTSHTDRLEHYQTQVTHTSVLLVLAFALCWLPSYGLMFAQLAYQPGNLSHYGPFDTFARVMAISSTVVNPILYVFMSHKFRKELKELIGRKSCGEQPS
ncbi:delta-type opioid receptor [Pygocentrus nattereri]|uniref:delta-type opioid receptor n=1 Tax=Pygocentrus nattereri TaxID=42514 RepID=UPI001890F654|nr:delta-type opioid receptor [Pygocentrus nattereri]